MKARAVSPLFALGLALAAALMVAAVLFPPAPEREEPEDLQAMRAAGL